MLARVPLLALFAAVLTLGGCDETDTPARVLLFTSGTKLYSVEGDGTGLRRIADVDARWPVRFSPGGERVAHSCRPDGDRDQPQTALCVRRLDGSEQRMVTEEQLDPPGFLDNGNFGTDIAWSADGRSVAFLVLRAAREDIVSSGDIYVYGVEDDSLRRIDEGEFAAGRLWLRWSPDGRYIASVHYKTIGSEGVLRVIDVHTGTAADVSRQLGTAVGIERYSWAPDSSAIAFTWNDFSGTVRLYSVAANGGTPVEVGEAWGGVVPEWSPAGDRIAASRVPGGSGFAILYVMPASGGPAQEIAPGFHTSQYPSWAWDGRRIAFVGSETSAPSPNEFPPYGLYVVDADGQSLRRLTADQEMVVFPLITWSPDGERIFYTADGPPCSEGCPPGPLFMVSAAGTGEPAHITEEDVLVSEFLGWWPRISD